MTDEKCTHEVSANADNNSVREGGNNMHVHAIRDMIISARL